MTAFFTSTVRKLSVALTVAASFSAISSTSSFAFSAEAQSMCTGDAFRLCSSEIPNVDRIVACLKRERPNLSKLPDGDQKLRGSARPPRLALLRYVTPGICREKRPDRDGDPQRVHYGGRMNQIIRELKRQAAGEKLSAEQLKGLIRAGYVYRNGDEHFLTDKGRDALAQLRVQPGESGF